MEGAKVTAGGEGGGDAAIVGSPLIAESRFPSVVGLAMRRLPASSAIAASFGIRRTTVPAAGFEAGARTSSSMTLVVLLMLVSSRRPVTSREKKGASPSDVTVSPPISRVKSAMLTDPPLLAAARITGSEKLTRIVKLRAWPASA